MALTRTTRFIHILRLCGSKRSRFVPTGFGSGLLAWDSWHSLIETFGLVRTDRGSGAAKVRNVPKMSSQTLATDLARSNAVPSIAPSNTEPVVLSSCCQTHKLTACLLTVTLSRKTEPRSWIVVFGGLLRRCAQPQSSAE